MKAKRKRRSSAETQPMAEVVRDMVAHFSQTGEYRAEDIRRVLGDPNGGVILEASPTAETAYMHALGR